MILPPCDHFLYSSFRSFLIFPEHPPYFVKQKRRTAKRVVLFILSGAGMIQADVSAKETTSMHRSNRFHKSVYNQWKCSQPQKCLCEDVTKASKFKKKTWYSCCSHLSIPSTLTGSLVGALDFNQEPSDPQMTALPSQAMLPKSLLSNKQSISDNPILWYCKTYYQQSSASAVKHTIPSQLSGDFSRRLHASVALPPVLAQPYCILWPPL